MQLDDQHAGRHACSQRMDSINWCCSITGRQFGEKQASPNSLEQPSWQKLSRPRDVPMFPSYSYPAQTHVQASPHDQVALTPWGTSRALEGVKEGRPKRLGPVLSPCAVVPQQSQIGLLSVKELPLVGCLVWQHLHGSCLSPQLSVAV